MIVSWGQWLTLLGTLMAVVGVPVGYLVQMVRRIDGNHSQLQEGQAALERRIGYVERDYATKEEWVREASLARKDLQEIREMLTSLQTAHDTETGLATTFTRMTEAIVAAVRQRDE